MTLSSAAEGLELHRELRSCSTCKKQFGKKSSLLRHLKICVGPYNKSRQKSCARCSATKSRCDLQFPNCGRCQTRQDVCEYTQPTQSIAQIVNPGRHFGPGTLQNSLSFAPQLPHTGTGFIESPHISPEFPIAPVVAVTASNEPFTSSPISSLGTAQSSDDRSTDNSFASMAAHFSDLNEDSSPGNKERQSCCPESWNRDRSFVPLPVEKLLSPLGKHSMRFAFRVLRTWPPMMVSIDRYMPPIFHHTQLKMKTVSLGNCFTIAKMWDGQQVKPSDLVVETTTREMTRIFQNYRKFDEAELLAALQSLCIYLVMLLFPKENIPSTMSIVDMAILSNLQQLVNYIGSLGLVLGEETKHSRPDWESWINMTSRRRAIFILYLIHWALSAYYGLSSFDCQELKYMLAPAPKPLWQAENRGEWESQYNQWLVEWEGLEYLHGEIAEIGECILLDDRSDRWLRDADEMGLLVMALVNAVD